ncbi:alpha/beta hydrolase family protein [Marinicella meishanensis]|uniref:alpha/beta hydrolase family protein n=1 Tax=Marinicella meishanensis TaxID=2873263 RepID=UPI001CBB5767|nr:acyl-CoA thioester hydrolase/BAAT C-terminal domain-containing protein [Marinicella sp. NBU2979]
MIWLWGMQIDDWMDNMKQINKPLPWLMLWSLMLGVSTGSSADNKYKAKSVDTPEVVGRLYLPTDHEQPVPAIIVLGGSGGRLNQVYAEQLAKAGFVVLALAYFNAPGRSSTLDRVPVETVSQGIDWLLAQPNVQTAGVGVLAVSRGTELAILAAAHDPRIQAVAALVPSSVAWQGQRGSVAWTLGGEDVATLTLPPAGDQTTWQRAQRALQTNQATQARLPVHMINGPILLVSVEQDHIWPSTAMAEELMQQLSDHPHEHRHLVLDDDHTLSPESQAQLAQPLLTLFSQLAAESTSH